MEEYYLKKEFKKNPAGFYIEQMKLKQKQAEQAVQGMRNVAGAAQNFNAAYNNSHLATMNQQYTSAPPGAAGF